MVQMAYITRPALEGGQGRPWPPQLFITPSTIEKIKPSEIIRVIFNSYGGHLMLDGVSSSNKFFVSKTVDWIQNSDISCSMAFHPPISCVSKTVDWIQNSLLPAEFV